MPTARRPSPTDPPEHRVVIVGGGFGGLYAAKTLRRTEGVHVTLLDRRNFHLFQPLLYQVASGWLAAAEIASPLRVVFEHDERIEVLLGEVVDVDLERREVVLRDGDRLPYDSLVVSAGAVVNHLGHEGWERLAPGLKSIEDAGELRRRILLAFEAAEREPEGPDRDRWLTFVVVGGGTTGVEMAGVLGELSREVLRGNFRHIDPARARIVLVQSPDRILPEFGEDLAAAAAKDLRRLGVTIRTGTRVTDIDEDGVALSVKATGRQERIEAATAIWAAGVSANPLAAQLAERAGLGLADGGRIEVSRDLSLPGHPEVYVIGDMALARSRGEEVPGLAPAAMQQGRHAARSIERRLRGEAPKSFRYHDRGQLATVGRGSAIAAMGPLRFDGFLAWIVWIFVHLAYLVEFESRVVVLLRWAWDFFRHERGSRLITGSTLLPTLRRSASMADGVVDAARPGEVPASLASPARPGAAQRARRVPARTPAARVGRGGIRFGRVVVEPKRPVGTR